MAGYDHGCPFDNNSVDAKLRKDSRDARSKTVCPMPITKLVPAQINMGCGSESFRGVCRRHSEAFRQYLSKPEQRAYFSAVATANDPTMLSVQGLLNTKVYSLMTAEHVANTLKNVQTIADGAVSSTQEVSPGIARNTVTIEEMLEQAHVTTRQATLGYTAPLYSHPDPPSPVTPTISLNPNLELLEELADCQTALDSLTEKYRELVAEKIEADFLIQNLRANLD